MKIAYWEICPYLVDIDPAHSADCLPEYVRNNAGKAFEFMVADADKARKAAGLKESCMECWTAHSEVCDAALHDFSQLPLLLHTRRCPHIAWKCAHVHYGTDISSLCVLFCFVDLLLYAQDEAIVAVVDENRAKFGLPTLRNAATKYETLLQQQKIETVEALSKVSLFMSIYPCLHQHLRLLKTGSA